MYTVQPAELAKTALPNPSCISAYATACKALEKNDGYKALSLSSPSTPFEPLNVGSEHSCCSFEAPLASPVAGPLWASHLPCCCLTAFHYRRHPHKPAVLAGHPLLPISSQTGRLIDCPASCRAQGATQDHSDVVPAALPLLVLLVSLASDAPAKTRRGQRGRHGQAAGKAGWCGSLTGRPAWRGEHLCAVTAAPF